MEPLVWLIVIFITYQLVVIVYGKLKPKNNKKKSQDSSGQKSQKQESWKEQIRQLLENMESSSSQENKPGSAGGAEGFESAEREKNSERLPSVKKILKSQEGSGGEAALPPKVKSARDSLAQPIMTKQDLVNGIVWAEILGKPRAHRPFRGSRR